MIEEIPLERIGTYEKYFPGLQTGMVLASIAAGNSKAQLWEATHPEGDARLLWDKANNVFYLSGHQLPKKTVETLTHFIATEIKGRAIEERKPYFRVRFLLSSDQNTPTELFQGFLFGQRRKLFYTFNQSQVTIPRPALAGLQFQRIDANFLRKDNLQNLHDIKEEIGGMWPSLARFCEKGFGFAALLDQAVICWCTAEYVSQALCGIGIATVESFWNKGIATATAAHFVDDCLRHHLTPHWECDGENIGSIRVAEKIGFEKIEEAIVWVGAFQHE